MVALNAFDSTDIVIARLILGWDFWILFVSTNPIFRGKNWGWNKPPQVMHFRMMLNE